MKQQCQLLYIDLCKRGDSNQELDFFYYTVWKVSKYAEFSGPYFPVFGLNTEIYSVNLRVQSEYRKIRTRKSSVFGHFPLSVREHQKKIFQFIYSICSLTSEFPNLKYISICKYTWIFLYVHAYSCAEIKGWQISFLFGY